MRRRRRWIRRWRSEGGKTNGQKSIQINKASAKTAFQIKVTLRDSRPPIWRRLHILSDTSLPDLHRILQTSMGWMNSHLHGFQFQGRLYGLPSEDSWDETIQVDYRKVRLDKLINKSKQKLVYEYDFGDGWEHEVLIEKVLPVDPKAKYPTCLDGALACPPEDCGGMPGYEELKEIMKSPKHPEYEERLEWVGEEFDPAAFDLKGINQELRKKNFGVFEF